MRPCGADLAFKKDLLEALAEACVDAWALSQPPIKQPCKAKNSSVQHKIDAAALERDGRGVLGGPLGNAGETGARPRRRRSSSARRNLRALNSFRRQRAPEWLAVVNMAGHNGGFWPLIRNPLAALAETGVAGDRR